MNHIYKSLMAVSLLAGAGFTAYAEDTYSVHLSVNDASQVKLEIDLVNYELQDGLNVIENLSGYNNLNIKAADGCYIKKVSGQDTSYGGSVQERTEEWSTSLWWGVGEYGTTTVTQYQINIETISFDEAATASFTYTVDDASKVNIGFYPKQLPSGVTGNYINGTNTIKYIPNVMEQVVVQPSEYSAPPLYQVKVNGELQEAPTYGLQYTIDITENMNLDVVTAYPDKEVPITFEFEKEGKAAITSVQLDGKEVSGWENGSITAKLGSYLMVSTNSTEYDNIEITWNGAPAYSSLSKYILEDTNAFTITAEKKPTFEATVNIDNADRITLWKGYSGSGVKVALKNGENVIEVPTSEETNWDTYEKYQVARITICPEDGYTIDEVLVNGEAAERASDFSYAINLLNETNTVNITTSQIVRDQTIVTYVNDRSFWSSLDLQSSNWASLIDMNQGYTVKSFATFELETNYVNGYLADYNSSTADACLFLNDVKQEAQNSWGFSYTFNADNHNQLTGGDVIKIYNDGMPATCNVTFEVAEAIADKFSGTYDVIKTLDTANGLTCLAGTQIAIISAEPLKVMVNGELVNAQTEQTEDEVATQAEEGYTYLINVAGNDTVEIAESNLVGVDAINAAAADTVIYNLQGVRVNSNNLPAGMYIINGKKVMVK